MSKTTDLPRCYCIDASLRVWNEDPTFELTLEDICYYRHNQESKTYSVFIQHSIIPVSRITGEFNVPLFHQYNFSEEKFIKHYIDLANWRDKQIDKILK